MHSRRDFLKVAITAVLGLYASNGYTRTSGPRARFEGEDVFERIMTAARAERWDCLPIGEVVGKIALQLQGTPYVASTLEVSADSEVCVVDLQRLDCVTFVENSLCLARLIKRGKHSPSDLIAEVSFTRYRGGKQQDYASRLHYTSDWFFDNEQKGVVRMLSDLPGSELYDKRVHFMSDNPQLYKQLQQHPELRQKMKLIEEQINQRRLNFIPIAKIASIEPMLMTGDIVGVCSSKPEGIDIIHTGLVYRDPQGVARFIHASSSRTKMKVTLDGALSTALNRSKDLTGVMLARPI